jgi:hypothetical protein
MKYFAIAVLTTLSLALTTVASAQHFRRSVEATVESVDVPTRTLDLKRPEGFYIRLHVPTTVTNWESMKPGDSVKVTYNENVITKVAKPGEKVYDRELTVPTTSQEDVHGNPDIERIVTATIVEIDPKYGNVTFTGPHGVRWAARVENPSLSKKLKPGDKVDLTYRQATVVSFQ